jgi:pullulanase/glycogen debranching enzyme
VGPLTDFADSPLESINYVECHDNHTLWDRINISTIDDARITPGDRRAMSSLAALLLLTARESLSSRRASHFDAQKMVIITPTTVRLCQYDQMAGRR